MTLTDFVLIFFIAVLLAWAIYDEFIMDKRHGKTQLCVTLLRRNVWHRYLMNFSFTVR